MSLLPKVALGLFCSCVCFALSAAGDRSLVGHAGKISDGDSFDLQTASGVVQVRIYGIDAPEFDQPHGKQSRAALAALLAGKRIQVTPKYRDDYQRIVARIEVGQTDVGLHLIRQGHAWAFRRYLGPADTGFCTAEDAARREGLGLWVQKRWIAPWDWRAKGHRPGLLDSVATLEKCLRALQKNARKKR